MSTVYRVLLVYYISYSCV